MKRSALRVTNAALTTILLLTVVICMPCPSGATAPDAVPVTSLTRGTTVNKLSLQERYALSAALGRDQASYHIRRDGETLAAANGAQGLTARFTRNGLEVHRGQYSWGMVLAGWGYGGTLTALKQALPRQRDNRVEYRRGPLTEWYVNGPFGLQQGFTLEKSPRARGNETGDLQLVLNLSGDLAVRPASDGHEIMLENRQGTAIFRYGGLMVYDAKGETVPARLAVDGRSLALRVDDRNAHYPLTIDPFIQAAKLTASDGAAEDLFGCSVAVSGDTLVVGAVHHDTDGNSDQGAAYVFERPETGWADMTQTAKLIASDGAAEDSFGCSVAISGDTVVIGAYGDNSKQGAAYVFERPETGWVDMTETAKLTASDGAASDFFGRSVAVSADTVIVGADSHDILGNAGQGAAYMFVRPEIGWATMTETAKLIASDGAAEDGFGFSVAASSETIVVGALGNDGNGDDSGAAYVFVRPEGGWTGSLNETAKLTASDGVASDLFGFSVAISGDTVVASAYIHGAAYVFVRPEGGWATMTETAKLTASDGAAEDGFGYSVAISGGTVIVGAVLHDILENADQGAAYVFVRPEGGWTGRLNETAKLTASDGAAEDRFGMSVAIKSGMAVVGAPFHDTGGNANQGETYIFSLSTTLTVTLAGSGSGSVTSSPAGIDCGGSCTADFPYGENVTLTAVPDAGFRFSGWSGDCTGGDPTATFTMDADKSCTAAFGIPGITVNPTSGLVTTEAGGTAAFSVVLDTRPTADVTIDCYSSDTTEGIVSPASLTFTPADWNMAQTVTVTGVNDDEDDGSRLYSIITAAAVSTDADYDGLNSDDVWLRNAEQTFILSVLMSGMGSGTVTIFPPGIYCDETFSADFGAGISITLDATADAGSAFAGWSGTACPGNGPCAVTLDRDLTVTATFAPDTDHDGAGDDLEDGGPHGGDGNNDGTLDSAQAHVATFRDVNGSYVTLISDAGTQLTGVTATTNPSGGDAPDGCSFTCGFFSFTITGLAPGQATTLTVLLHMKDTDLNAYYKYGPTPGNASDHWYEFMYGGVTGATITQEETQTRIVLHLTDGATGDDDLLANGAITDVGAPGTVAASGGGSTGSSGGGGCFIDTAR